MSSVFTLDDDPIVIVVPSSADIPPGNITEVDWLELKDRVTIVEANGLGDLSDVDAEGEAGSALIKQEDGTFAFGTQQGSIERVLDGDSETVMWGVRELLFLSPFAPVPHPSFDGRVNVGINVGTTSNTVASGNHRHTQPTPVRGTAAPSGYMSGGSRTIGSTPLSVTLATGTNYIVEAELYGQLRGADSGAAYYTLSINIGGNTFTSPGGEDGFWCVQGVPDKIFWEHNRLITGTGSSVSVSASLNWHSGSGLNVDRTYLKVRLRPDR